jgi:chitinase
VVPSGSMVRGDVPAALVAVLVGCGGGGGGTDGGDAGLDAGTGPDSGADAGADASAPDAGAPSGRWSMGYYASWQADRYPIDSIEWSGLTHVAMSFYEPQADGSLELLSGDPALGQTLVAAAVAHGVAPVASIGGSDSAPSFRTATEADVLDAFVASLVALLDAGYQGIDIDWEPLETTDEARAIQIAERVRAARPSVLMTIPVGIVNINIPQDLSGYPALAAAYDQMNLMSYGMSGAWEGWKSWHSSPLYQEDLATPTSIDSTVSLYEAAGVPLAKLGVGIGFFGLCYGPPVTAPDQALDGATILASDGDMSFTRIMAIFDSAARQWDPLARVPYLSFTADAAPDGCTYLSYEDEQSIAEKADYLEARGLGGVIEWEINEGVVADAPAGERDPLLLAIRDQILE